MYQTVCTAANPVLTEELLWTLPGVVAVEHAIQPQGQLTVYSEQPILDELDKMLNVTVQHHKPVHEADWADSWKQHWQVTPITPTLTVQPSWQNYTKKQKDETVIVLDPASAFGTGEHETTKLMLLFLDTLRKQHSFSQLAVLDVGTGSGILAIACALFGSTQVTGQDIDPSVLPVCESNAALNQQAHIHWTATPLEDLCLTRYDLVLANILAPVIVSLMPELVARLQPGGMLLCSGIIEKAVSSVMTTAEAHGLVHHQTLSDKQWRALLFTRP
jgi:ribosomal protein L11 methyltransferase